LFPAFEERTEMKAGRPTTVMRMEHRQMEALVQDMITTLGRGGDSARVVERANAFSSLMESYDKKEEGMLYPMMDRAFGEEERSALLARTSLGRRDP
jgi:regulator of cell morphogenesis and NO signaling